MVKNLQRVAMDVLTEAIYINVQERLIQKYKR